MAPTVSPGYITARLSLSHSSSTKNLNCRSVNPNFLFFMYCESNSIFFMTEDFLPCFKRSFSSSSGSLVSSFSNSLVTFSKYFYNRSMCTPNWLSSRSGSLLSIRILSISSVNILLIWAGVRNSSLGRFGSTFLT